MSRALAPALGRRVDGVSEAAYLARRSKAPLAGRRMHAAARADAAVLRRVPLAVFQPKFFPFAAVHPRLARIRSRRPRDEEGAASGGHCCGNEEELHRLHLECCADCCGWMVCELALPHGLVHLLMRCVALQFGASAYRCWTLLLGALLSSRRGLVAASKMARQKSKLASP